MPDAADHPLDYLDTPPAAAAFLDGIADARELAVDTEGASFHRFIDRIYLLQLSTRERSAILDPLPIGAPEGLRRLIESPDVEKVFHDADYDLRLLHQDYGWSVRRVFDTRIAAQLVGLRAFGLAALLEKEFGVKLDKQYQRADWSQRPLTRGMLDYAAQDTRWLLDLRDRLRAELERLGRLAWAEEEFARLESVRWDTDDAANAFLRLKGARDLNRRELAVLREVVQWRDGVARAQDRATFRVTGNETLFALARQQPTTREALGAVKGMPRGVLEQRGQEVLEAVARGLAVPEAELPRFPRAPRWERDPDFDDRVSRVRAVRDEAARQLDLDPGVLCSRDRLESVARKRPTTVEELAALPDLRRWQVEVLGAELVRALNAGGAPPAPVAAPAPTPTPAAASESPYREG
jgi:ribonuclease D